ncbi:hypothetical protein [Streptosporangium vulgare]|uniref:Uncharacterized protein n=1 Tax=Streptosporangium vulgare TaxID=46190 RepID=A0ABV5TES4_9ACTN
MASYGGTWADGGQVTLNPRGGFAGRTASAENDIKVPYSRIEDRF